MKPFRWKPVLVTVGLYLLTMSGFFLVVSVVRLGTYENIAERFLVSFLSHVVNSFFYTSISYLTKSNLLLIFVGLFGCFLLLNLTAAYSRTTSGLVPAGILAAVIHAALFVGIELIVRKLEP